MSEITKEEFCRLFVEHMTNEAGFETFNDGRPVREYAERVALTTGRAAAEAGMDCWRIEHVQRHNPGQRNSGKIRRDGDLIRKENARLKRMLKDAGEGLRAAGKQPWQFGIAGS